MTLETIQFKTVDGLTVTADYYAAPKPSGIMVLCHRSHFNRGEYHESAPTFVSMGYSCLAIDQRSGMKVMGTVNETYKLAKEMGLATGYRDARPDVEAAIDYAFDLNAKSPVIVVGSSYSASLALLMAAEHNRRISAVIAFSPGEYLKVVDLSEKLGAIDVPVLVLSAKNEIETTSALLNKTDAKLVRQFRPTTQGAHGARVLWSKIPGNEEYWAEITSFLKAHWSQ